MASGDTLVTFVPSQAEPPTTNYAQYDERTNGRSVLAFDTTTQEAAMFPFVLPRNYAGGGITVYVHWAAVQTTGTVGWDIAFESDAAAAQDLDADNFATAQTVTAATVDGTSGNVTVTNVAVTNGANIASITVGTLARLRIRRDVANDTSAGDAHLVAIELKET